MALSEKRRQKKLAKKSSKRKDKLAGQRANAEELKSLNTQIIRYSSKPILECLSPKSLFDIGLGNIILSRRISDEKVAISMFLVDVYCLGVKNVHFAQMPIYEYENHTEKHKQEYGTIDIEPSCALKIITGAVAYAIDLGFSPHKDYDSVIKTFGDVDSDDCPIEFIYGKDGKPFFIASPKDNAAKCKKVMDMLENKCGVDGYRFVTPMSEIDMDDIN